MGDTAISLLIRIFVHRLKSLNQSYPRVPYPMIKHYQVYQQSFHGASNYMRISERTEKA